MKNIGYVAGMVAATLVMGSAFADVTDADKKTVTSKAYVDTELLEKQDAITAIQDGSDYAMTYPETTGGQPRARKIETELANDDHLVTRGAVVAAINAKQVKIENGTPNNVITYNASGAVGGTGGVTGRAVYSDSGTYSGNSNNLAEAQHVNAAVQNGFNAHLVCNTWDDGYNQNSPNAADYCLTYEVKTLSGTYVPETTTP